MPHSLPLEMNRNHRSHGMKKKKKRLRIQWNCEIEAKGDYEKCKAIHHDSFKMWCQMASEFP